MQLESQIASSGRNSCGQRESKECNLFTKRGRGKYSLIFFCPLHILQASDLFSVGEMKFVEKIEIKKEHILPPCITEANGAAFQINGWWNWKLCWPWPRKLRKSSRHTRWLSVSLIQTKCKSHASFTLSWIVLHFRLKESKDLTHTCTSFLFLPNCSGRRRRRRSLVSFESFNWKIWVEFLTKLENLNLKTKTKRIPIENECAN